MGCPDILGSLSLIPTWGIIDKTQGHRENLQEQGFSAVPVRADF